VIKLLICDWDGTLMDSEATIVAAMSAAYCALDLPSPAYSAIRHIIGLSLEHAVSRLSPDLAVSLRAEIVAGYRREYATIADTPILFPGVRETLGMLQSSGMHLAVATGKSRAGLARAMAQTGLTSLFVTTRTADESEPKPSPAMLHEILDDLDLAPGDACMLGDTEYDLAMAAAAGMRGAAVSYGAHAPGQLRRHRPVFMLDDFAELPAQLEALTGS